MFTHYGKLVCLVCVCVCVCVCVSVCLCVLLFYSQPTLCDPIDCSPAESSVHGILQARILEWVAMPFSRGSSCQGSNLHLLHLLHWQAGFLPLAPPGKPIWLTMDQKTLSEATKISDHFIILPSPVSQCLLLENYCRDDATVCSSFFLLLSPLLSLMGFVHTCKFNPPPKLTVTW